MTIPNVSATPSVWSNTELAENAQKALEEFVERRLAEPGGKYLAHVRARRSAIVRLFKLLANIDPAAPDPETVRFILLDDGLFDALRYVAGPPVSEDDLGVLVTRDVKGFNKATLKSDDSLSVAVMKLICKLSDPFRFPWVVAAAEPPVMSCGPQSRQQQQCTQARRCRPSAEGMAKSLNGDLSSGSRN